jgi:SHS2 domain-containing protein
VVPYDCRLRWIVVEQVPFETVSHTADIALLVRGRTMGELLSHAALALYDLTTTGPGSHAPACRSIAIDSVDDDSLLVDWLNELIYFLYTERFVFTEFTFHELTAGHLVARCCGAHLSAGAGDLRREVKAATHHMVHISQTQDGYSAQVVLDV